MDTRRLITAVLVTIMAVMAWQIGMDWLGRQLGYDMTRRPADETEQTEQTDTVAQVPTTAPTTGPTTAPGSAPGQITAATAPLRPAVVEPAAPVRIGSTERRDPSYRMAVELVPQGAAIQQVILNEFSREVRSPDPFVFQQPIPGMEPATRSMATLSAVIDGNRVSLADVAWQVEAANADSAVFSTIIEGGAGPVLRLRKHYRLLPAEDQSRGYEVVVTHSVENLSPEPRTVQLLLNGPTTPPREVDRGPDRHIVSGYRYSGQVGVESHPIEGLEGERQTLDITRHEQYPTVWAGALSVYFNAIARQVEGQEGALAVPISRIEGLSFNPDRPSPEREGGVRFETAEVEVPPNQAAQLTMHVFFGPRQRSLLKEDYYLALGYNQTLVLTAGICAICTFQWLIDVLVLLLRGFHAVFNDWGVAIICLVVLVRLLLHPITKKSQISMMKMAKLGPEIERLRKKYGDNKEELNKAMLEFHKQQGVGPYLGCLPMFLQMPIWIALWSALYSTFELRHAAFLWGFTWIHDLARPDHLIEFSRPVSIFFLTISGINLLPILMGVVFYLQMKLQPKPATMTKEQEQQQKIMMWMMPLLFPIMLYSGPSGLNLYILTSTFIGIIESKRIRDHIKRQEEAEAQQRVIIDAKPTRGSKKARRLGTPPDEPRKRGVTGWLANLQDWVEQQRREQERRGKDKA